MDGLEGLPLFEALLRHAPARYARVPYKDAVAL